MNPLFIDSNKPTLGHGEFTAHATSAVFWFTPSIALPDDDQTVLVHLDDGEIWTSFRDSGDWRYVSGELIEAEILHWAEFPEPPKP